MNLISVIPTQDAPSAEGTEAALGALMGLTARLLRAPTALLLAIRGDQVWCRAAHGLDVLEVDTEGAAYLPALQAQRLLLIEDASLDPRFSSHPWVAGQQHVRMFLAMMLQRPEQPDYVLCVIDSAPRRLDPAGEEAALLEEVVGVLEPLLGRQASVPLQDQLLRQTFQDVIRAIPNVRSARARLEQMLARTRQTQEMMGVLVVRLRELTTLRSTVEEGVFLEAMALLQGRFGALGVPVEQVYLSENELALLCAPLEVASVARALAWVVLERLREPVLAQGQRLDFDGHIGISISALDRTADDLLAQARLAAAEAARREGVEICLYDRALQSHLEERLHIVARLRGAAERGEMWLVYQPKVCPYSLRVDSVEALLRWDSPDLGIVSPGRFIPLAEESGIIAGLGGWILRRACADACRWRAQGFAVAVAVNVSAAQFQQPDFPEQVAVALQDTGLPPEALEIEITETAILRTHARVRQTLRLLRQMGVRIALDDFGTGYSSLSQLRSLPLDTVKIDRSFVAEMHTRPQDAVVFASVARMLHDLGMSIVVEGIEHVEQLDIVRQSRCEWVQGWVYSRALSFEDLCTFLAQSPPASAEAAEAAGGAEGMALRAV